MDFVELDPRIKEILRTYSVPNDVITLIEKEKNLSMQAVEEVYVEQIQEIQQSSKKQQGKRSKSENDFMKMLQSNRIIGK